VRSSAPATSSRGFSSSSSGSYGASHVSDRSFGGSPMYTSPTGISRNVPSLKGTSFYSYNHYYYWNDFYFQLMSRYFFDRMYFTRFYRNSEPLLTPRLQKLAVRDPLVLSRQMIAAVDELSDMLEKRQSGQPIDRDLILNRIHEIKDLAKRIRGDELLPYVDQRKGVDVLRGKDIDNLGLEALEDLRAIALDLNSQLRNMYDESSTATVSVSHFSQPSFSSLSKGIERLCKVMESSAKRL
jgi:hypothetical protein